MALKPCAECGNSVSTTAKSCPKCGAAVPQGTSTTTWVIGGFFALAIGMGIWPRDEAAQGSQAAPITAEQRAAQQRAAADKARADKEINTVLNGARWLKNSMKKPESFELERAIMIDGKVICYEYRARNSFNDRRASVHVISDTVNSGDAKAWNQLCAGKSGTDYTHVRAVL